jgi:hypothetical protein
MDIKTTQTEYGEVTIITEDDKLTIIHNGQTTVVAR